MDVRKHYSPTPIRGSDLDGPTEFVIKEVANKTDDYNRLPVTFSDGSTFNCNDRQMEMIAKATKEYESDNWRGHTIVLVPEQVNITDRETGQPKTVVTVKIKAAGGNTGEQVELNRKEMGDAESSMRRPSHNDLDDDIPF